MKKYQLEITTSLIIILPLLLYVILSLIGVLPNPITLYAINVLTVQGDVDFFSVIRSYIILALFNWFLTLLIAHAKLDHIPYRLARILPYLFSIILAFTLLLTIFMNLRF